MDTKKVGKKITRKFPNTKKKKSSNPSGLSQVLDLAIFMEAAPGSGLTGGSPSRGKQLYTFSTCTASNFAPKARRPCADTRREGCEQSARLGNGGSSAMTFHHAPCINLHGGEKRGKKWKKIIKKKSTFSPHLLQISQILAQKKAGVIFLSSLGHHERRTGTMAWPKHPRGLLLPGVRGCPGCCQGNFQHLSTIWACSVPPNTQRKILARGESPPAQSRTKGTKNSSP